MLVRPKEIEDWTMDEIVGLADALSRLSGKQTVKPLKSYHRAAIERLRRLGR